MISKMQVSSLTFVLIMMASAAIVAPAVITTTEAHNNNEVIPPPQAASNKVVVIKGPGVSPPRGGGFDDDEVTMSCWMGLIRSYGCIPQIYEAVYQQRFDHIDAVCCVNIVNIIDSCWPRMFPKHPEVLRLLKKHCSYAATPATTTTTVNKSP